MSKKYIIDRNAGCLLLFFVGLWWMSWFPDLLADFMDCSDEFAAGTSVLLLAIGIIAWSRYCTVNDL